MRAITDIYEEAEDNGLYTISVIDEDLTFYVSATVYDNIDVDSSGCCTLYGVDVYLDNFSNDDDDNFDILYGYDPGDYYTPDAEYEIYRTINTEKVDYWEYQAIGGDYFGFDECMIYETLEEVKEILKKYNDKIA